jgi:hypothetical protein
MTATHGSLVAFERAHHEEPLRGSSAKQKNGIMDTSQKNGEDEISNQNEGCRCSFGSPFVR